MAASYRGVPEHKLAQLNVRVHPGYKRKVKARCVEQGVEVQEFMDLLLGSIFGDPGPVEPSRRPLEPAHVS